MQHKTVAAVR